MNVNWLRVGVLGDIIHILPTNDLKNHDDGLECWCEPQIRTEGKNKLVIHNSADGREFFEKDIVVKETFTNH